MSKGSKAKERNGTNVFQKDLENTTGLLVDQTRDTLHATSTSETTDGGLRDALDVVAKDLAVTLCAALSKTLKFLVSGCERKEEIARNTPFHPFHGQTLCDKCFVRGELKMRLCAASGWDAECASNSEPRLPLYPDGSPT